MGPISSNNQGGFCALNLKTGQKIKRTHATILPATNIVITWVHAAMATKDKMSNGLIFVSWTGNTIINDLNTTANAEDNDASGDDYSNK